MNTRLGAICDRIPQAGSLIVLIAIPLFFHTNSARTFEPDKVTILRCVTCAIVVAWAIGLLEKSPGRLHVLLGSSAGAIASWARHPVVACALVLILCSVLSTALSISPRISLWGSYDRLQGTYTFLCYLVLFGALSTSLKTAADIDRVVTAAILASVPVSVYGILQKIGLDPVDWEGDAMKRVGSTFGNAVFLGSYLVMVMPLTISRLAQSLAWADDRERVGLHRFMAASFYLLVAVLQALAVLFSQSRGPMLGLSGGLFTMGLVFALRLQRYSVDKGRIRMREALKAFALAILAWTSAAVGAGVGGLAGVGLRRLELFPSAQSAAVPIVVGLAVGLMSFGLVYMLVVLTGRGRRWLWLSWTANLCVIVAMVVMLNSRSSPWDLRSPSFRKLPYVGRVVGVLDPANAAVRIRRLIWDSAVRRVTTERPLGVPQDVVSGQDPLHGMRPLVGYGPESLFNTLASVYPPQLKYLEVPTRLADRCHNESLDWLVTRGILGMLAYFALMMALVARCGSRLGFTAEKSSPWGWTVSLALGAVGGGLAAWFAGGWDTSLALGVPFGLLGGLVLHLVLPGWSGSESAGRAGEARLGRPMTLPEDASLHGGGGVQPLNENAGTKHTDLLLLGLLAAIVAHFVEVQFSFSHATTYVYFWAIAGVVVALDRMPEPCDMRLEGADKTATARINGLATAVVLGILVFTFVTPSLRLQPSHPRTMILGAMAAGVLCAGLAMTLTAIRKYGSRNSAPWRRALELFLASSVAYPALYFVVHRLQLARAGWLAADGYQLRMANVAVTSLLLFYGYLLLMLVLLASTLSQSAGKPMLLVRKRLVWAYAVLVLSASWFIWQTNINVIRADIYLKEGNYYRELEQWDQAILLHRQARSMYPEEDDYSLTLAQDYFLMGRDQRTDAERCAKAWRSSERIALEAHRLNPYNPEHAANLGRLYVNIGRYLDERKFRDALHYFEKSTLLAPTKVEYHNLWAQTHRLLENHAAAVARLSVSASIDDQYPATWVLLGDTYADMGQFDKALRAHTRALRLRGPRKDGFAAMTDANLPQRLAAYDRSGRLGALTAVVHKHASIDQQQRWEDAVEQLRGGKR